MTLTETKKALKIALAAGSGLLIVVGIGIGIYLFVFKSRPTVAGTKTETPSEVAVNQPEASTIIAEVSMLIELPTDEEPTVATISDITKLSNQPFFQKASTGDVVLIYTQAKKAYIYRPSLKKIINVETVTLDTPTATPPISQPITPTSTNVPISPTQIPLLSPSPASPQ